uniref:Uncharacterized protein n=1 Tax=Drosophila melanogaster TaxID=7227 RepID=A0A0B4KGR8_DROME|nr:uncharacterized protein Dmel_CG44044 [Drosophila melanogaster]AGB96008.1 uncharacterized protein Dmel_CG44044 [Drosophila melanogaster]|eukprot:NP_001262628.1 uncharacterized protein Dmel_CG44044 [Drosophila melanogaster]
MPESSSWTRTYLNWKRVLFLSLKCVYLMMVVKFSQRCLEMAFKSQFAQRQTENAQVGSQSRGEALT